MILGFPRHILAEITLLSSNTQTFGYFNKETGTWMNYCGNIQKLQLSFRIKVNC